MPKSLSIDLRSRVLAAISGGVSCREAARRFGVSAASAIRWQSLSKTRGDARPKPQGGDQRSSRTEAHSAAILKLYQDKPDITLAEIRASLSQIIVAFRRHTLLPLDDCLYALQPTFKARPLRSVTSIVGANRPA